MKTDYTTIRQAVIDAVKKERLFDWEDDPWAEETTESLADHVEGIRDHALKHPDGYLAEARQWLARSSETEANFSRGHIAETIARAAYYNTRFLRSVSEVLEAKIRALEVMVSARSLVAAEKEEGTPDQIYDLEVIKDFKEEISDQISSLKSLKRDELAHYETCESAQKNHGEAGS